MQQISTKLDLVSHKNANEFMNNPLPFSVCDFHCFWTNIYRILVRKRQRKGTFYRHGCKWQDNNKCILKKYRAFIMFSLIKNIYSKKTKGPTLLELFTATGKLWRVCGKNLNIISMCDVSPVVHTSNMSSCQKRTFSVFLWLWTIPLR